MPRPTKFNKKAVEKANKYVNECIKNQTMPTVEGLAIDILNVDDETVTEWTKTHDSDDDATLKLRREFSATIKRLKSNQKRHLMIQGLAGKVNPTMAIFLLKANHGLKETERREHTGKDGDPLPEPQNTMIIYRPKKLPFDYDYQKPKKVKAVDGTATGQTTPAPNTPANN